MKQVANVTTNLLSRVCKDISKEPILSSTPTSNYDLWANTSSQGIWQRMQQAFVDIKVFYPFTPRY